MPTLKLVPTTRTAVEIAATAAEQAATIRRAERAKDIAAWRRVVTDIADGHEPDGAVLATIAILTARLDLPEGSLAKHVAAVQLERTLVVNAEEADRVSKAAEAEMAALGEQLREAERRLAELRDKSYANILDQQNGVWQRVRLDDHRNAYPMLFAVTDNLNRKAG